jgi:hypothetical protein
MKIKTTLAALALMLSPGMLMAGEGCGGSMKHEVTASTCAQGAVWDETKGMCVVQPSS